jgi:small conductance mechanosensitive channel
MLHEEEIADQKRVSGWSSTLLSVGIVLALLVAGIVLFTVVTSSHLLPTNDTGYLRIALIIGLGTAAVVLVGRIVHGVSRRFTGRRHAGLVVDVYRIVAYSLLAIVVLYALGVNGYALLAGGTFAGLVIGLASQAALGNFVAGIVLVLARPFEPGDRITLSSSQFSFLLPSYSPKFYSQDLLIPGFTGSVQDIGLMYTALRLDDGPIALFPNSAVLVSAVIAHELTERWVRVKYEVPSAVDPARVLVVVRDAVRLDDWVVQKDSVRVYINQATAASYAISVDAVCAGNLEEPPRSALYVRIIKAVATLAPSPTTPPSPVAGSAPPPTQPPPPPPPSAPPAEAALTGH